MVYSQNSQEQRDPLTEFSIAFDDLHLGECTRQGNSRDVFTGKWHGDVLIHCYQWVTITLTPALVLLTEMAQKCKFFTPKCSETFRFPEKASHYTNLTICIYFQWHKPRGKVQFLENGFSAWKNTSWERGSLHGCLSRRAKLGHCYQVNAYRAIFLENLLFSWCLDWHMYIYRESVWPISYAIWSHDVMPT